MSRIALVLALALLSGCSASPRPVVLVDEPAVQLASVQEPVVALAALAPRPLRLGAGDALGLLVYEHALAVARAGRRDEDMLSGAGEPTFSR